MPCVRVFALVGGDPDLGSLRQVGAKIADDGRPVYASETYETSVPGLYVAGHVTRELHMANAVLMAPQIVHRIAGRKPSEHGASLPAALFARAMRSLRAKSPLVWRLARDHAWLRELVQATDALNLLRIRKPLSRRLAQRLILQRAKA